MLQIIIKFLFPLVLIYLGVRVLRKVIGTGNAKRNGDLTDGYPRNQPKDPNNVIEICPKCGRVREKHHKCPA